MKKTTWNKERYFNYIYYTRYSDLRATIKNSTGVVVDDEKIKKIYGGFFNILIHVNPKTFGIFEVSDKIKISYIGKPEVQLDKNVTSVIAVCLGGRYFFNKSISIDAGII